MVNNKYLQIEKNKEISSLGATEERVGGGTEI